MPRAIPLSALLALGACTDDAARQRVEPTFIEVAVQGDAGSEDAPLAFSAEPRTFTVTATTLDRNADPWPFEGDLSVRVRPGRIDGASCDSYLNDATHHEQCFVHLTDGTWTGEVSFEDAFGPTRIWLSDEGDKDASSDRQATFATGVTEPIWIEKPTLAEMQRTDDNDTNQLDGEYAELRVADREVVVTWLGTAGFWATDLSEPDGPANYAHIFVYTFSKPEGLERGSRITLLQGVNQEYLATSQLSFPAYEAEGTLEVPDYAALDGDMVCDDATMEALESALVEAEGLTIPGTFGSSEQDEDYLDYIDYGQWPATFGDQGCTLYVDSSAIDGFDPTAHAGESLGVVRGVLSQVWGKWILVANDESELSVGDPVAARAPEGLRRPRPRPRVRPSPEQRERSLDKPVPPASACRHATGVHLAH